MKLNKLLEDFYLPKLEKNDESKLIKMLRKQARLDPKEFEASLSKINKIRQSEGLKPITKEQLLIKKPSDIANALAYNRQTKDINIPAKKTKKIDFTDLVGAPASPPLPPKKRTLIGPMPPFTEPKEIQIKDKRKTPKTQEEKDNYQRFKVGDKVKLKNQKGIWTIRGKIESGYYTLHRNSDSDLDTQYSPQGLNTVAKPDEISHFDNKGKVIRVRESF